MAARPDISNSLLQASSLIHPRIPGHSNIKTLERYIKAGELETVKKISALIEESRKRVAATSWRMSRREITAPRTGGM